MNLALKTSTFPQEWKIAKVRALPKANGHDYRPISLLSNLGKILEKIVEKRMRESVGSRLNPIQHGCRPMHSTQIALSRFTHQASLAAAEENSFGAVAFDFSKAYDRVPHHLLIYKLNKMKISPELILFIHNWLSERKFRVHHRRAISSLFSMTNGIPQGSALSVLLWLIFINDLGDALDESTTNLFVDDTLIWSTKLSRAALYHDLAAKSTIVYDWARRNKVKINWNKTQFTHSSYHHSDPPLKIATHTCYPQSTLKYLGVQFTHNVSAQTLFFDLSHLATELRRRSAMVHRLHSFPFSPTVIRQFMNAWVYSPLRYLTPLLGAETHHQATLQQLDKAYNVCLRTELDAFISTPISLLYAGTRRLPLKALIERDTSILTLRAISGSTKLGTEYLDWDGTYDGWSPLGCTIPVFNSIKLYDYDIQFRYPMSISMRNGLAHCNYIIPPTKTKASRRRIPTDADLELWTDGSFEIKTHTGASAAILVSRHDNDEHIEEDAKCYTRLSSSYEAELMALLLGLQMLITRDPRNKKIRIFTDSRSLATHLQSAGLRYKVEEHDFCQVASLLTRLNIHNIIYIHWIPGHSGIERNEKVDRLANSAMLALPPEPHVPRHSYYSAAITKLSRLKYILPLRDKIRPSHWANYPPRNIFKEGQLRFCRGAPFRILTGHTRTNHHLYNLGMVQSPICNFCLLEDQTPDHLLLRCEQFQEHTKPLRQWAADHTTKCAFQLVQANPQRVERLVVPVLRAGAWI